MKVLIVYYSTYGNVHKMAQLVAEGVEEIPGAEPVLRTVPELIPQAVIDSRADMKAGRDLLKGVPLVTADDFRQAGAVAFGTPLDSATFRPSSRIRSTSSRPSGSKASWRASQPASSSPLEVCTAGRRRRSSH